MLLAPPAKLDARGIVGYPAGKLVVNPGRLAIMKGDNLTTAGTNVVSKAWLAGGAGTPDLSELVLTT